jgi:hypothetical protein
MSEEDGDNSLEGILPLSPDSEWTRGRKNRTQYF